MVETTLEPQSNPEGALAFNLWLRYAVHRGTSPLQQNFACRNAGGKLTFNALHFFSQRSSRLLRCTIRLKSNFLLVTERCVAILRGLLSESAKTGVYLIVSCRAETAFMAERLVN
uniref:(northern house mosquito) hypothetical protein n=1 Tax=Culex pipiens TaxID=7175 RepID=A0A8D8ILJ2_CULPI